MPQSRGWIGGAGKARRRGIVGAIPRRSNAASVVEPPPNLVTDFGFGTLGRGPALARVLGAALADAHDADARELEVSCERAMRPALGTQAADLLVALRLHAAREAAGQDRGLRDADAEGLRHHGERPALVSRPDLADQATDRVLEDGAHERALTGGRTPLGPDCVFALLAQIKHIGIFSFILA